MRHHNFTPDPESGLPRPSRPQHDFTPQPLADREVPLPRSLTPPVVQAWLDGEATRTMVLSNPGGNDAVDLWTRINSEAELLRTRTTPLYVHKRIMESIPDNLPRPRPNHPWYKKPVLMHPMTLLAAAAACLGLGALIARVVAR